MTSREIAFIDPGIPDLETFVAGLRPGLAAVVLSADRAAPAQIAEALRDSSEVDAVHIVAHGAPGQILFSSGALTKATLPPYAAALAEIGDALAPSGLLLLWACEIGKAPRGRAFMEALEDVAGTRVAAATGLVGASARGGSWDVSALGAPVAARAPLTGEAIERYAAVLDNYQATSGQDTRIQTTGSDTVSFTFADQVNPTDFFDGNLGIDALVIGFQVALDFYVLGTDATHGLHNYEILFLSNNCAVTFNGAQFGDGLVSNDLLILTPTPNDTTFQGITINNASNFSAAGWAIPVWSPNSDILINGTPGADTITGSSMPDFINGGNGNDFVDGGQHNDTVLIGSSATGYSFRRVDGATTSWVVTDTDTNDGNTGTDTLTNVEAMSFGGGGSIFFSQLIGALTDSNLVGDSVVEGSPAAGSQVGITAFAADGSLQTVTYSLITNAGGRFAINSAGVVTVQSGAVFDFESAASHAIVVRATSADGSFTDRQCTVNVTDVNEVPTAVALENTIGAIAEGTSTALPIKVANIVVTDDAVGTETLNLIGPDAASFEIQGLGLFLKAGTTLDFEAKQSYVVAVTVDDPAFGSGIELTSSPFVLSVADVNEAPTDIVLSASSIQEFRVAGTAVGVLSAVDVNSGETVSFTLLDDAGGRFAINGNQLVVADGLRLDFEQAASHQVTVRATDGSGLSFDEILTISVGDVNPETVVGDSAANTIFGGGLDDSLSGSAGADILVGNAGRDALTGGGGRDRLTGGAERDVFDFNKIGETGKGLAKRDIITDFSHAQRDKIDLSTIDAEKGGGNQRFHFLGDNPFDGEKGALHYVFQGANKTIVEGDTNGDGIDNFQIQLTGHIALVRGDFVL